MDRTKFGRSAAIAVAALAIPIGAAAQTTTPSQPQGTQPSGSIATPNQDQQIQFTTLQGAIAKQASVNQAFSAGNTTIAQGDIALAPVSRVQMSAADRATLDKAMTPSAQAALQAALGKATVSLDNQSAGTLGGPGTSTLAEHLKRLGVDPANVIAVATGPKAAGGSGQLVTVYYRDKGMPQTPVH
jgi:hypothetical protein